MTEFATKLFLIYIKILLKAAQTKLQNFEYVA